ncbi:MAG: alpha/beta hydrolase [Nitrospirota bacterium]|nr:alpha/beta hydrolase [Nitrospirota bacterium]
MARVIKPPLGLWLLLAMLLAPLAAMVHATEDWRAFAEDPEHAKFIDVEGVRTHYIDMGSGSPVVFVHGLGAWSYSWRKNLEVTAKLGYRVIAVDLKGFGLSGKPEPVAKEDYSVADQTRFLKRFLEALWIGKADIVGNSMGGSVALYFAFTYPASTNRIVVVDPACYKQRFPLLLWAVKAPVIGRMSEVFMGRTTAKMVLKQVYADPKKISDDMVEAYAMPLSLKGGKRAFRMAAKRLLPEDYDRVVAAYKQIQAPALVVWGEKDGWISPDMGRRLAKDLPNARLVIMKGCGHIPMEECPQGFNQVLSAFLKKAPKSKTP